MSLIAFFQDSFLQMALWAALLASIASGTIGSFVVVKRIAFIAGSISHSIIGGVGFSLWLTRTWHLPWPDPLSGALLASLISALLIGWIHLNYRQREDAVIAAIWSTGMSLGILFFTLTPGTSGELINVLFGNILWTSPRELLLLATLDLLLLSTIALYYRRFLAICFDETQALLRGIPVQRLYLLLLSLVGLSIVLLMQVIGTILVLALLIIPPTIASLFTSRLIIMMGLATLFSATASFLGLSASYLLDWPPGSTIALLTASCYFTLLPLKKKKLNFR